jgi:hypothetical protein
VNPVEAVFLLTEVNDLLMRFSEMRKMMKNMGKMKELMARAQGANVRIRLTTTDYGRFHSPSP